jgi:cell division protein FtsB
MQKLLFHPITVIFFTVIAVIFYFSLEKSAGTAETSVVTLQKLQQDTEKLNQEVQQLEGKLTDSQNTVAKEKIVRDELLMQKPGEYAIQIPDVDHTEVVPTQPPATPTPWEDWQDILL